MILMPAIDLKNHFCLQHKDQLKTINAPLQLLGVDGFCFTSLDLKTGERYLLSDHPEWIQFSYNSDFYETEIATKIETDDFLECFIWKDFTKNKAWHEKRTQASEFGLRHGVTFLQRANNKMNMYYMSTSNDQLSEQYLFDLSDQLCQFIPYFHYQARDLIRESQQHSFIARKPTDTNTITLDQKVLQQFQDAISIKQLVINESGDCLTHQEVLCVYFTLQGKSQKQIAEKLAISVRTVEKHIYNIRIKLNLSPHDSILNYFFHSIFFKQIILYGQQYY